MQINNVANQLKDLINPSKRILVVTGTNPSLDGLAAVLGLYQLLVTFKKEVVVGVGGEVPPAANILPGFEKLITSLGPHNLVISFDYVEGSIEKVSYNVEGNKFNLVITPREGMINPDQIQYSYSGSNFDLIFVVDTPDLHQLGKLFDQMLFSSAATVNVDHHSSNAQFGKINVVDPSSSSTSQLLVNLFKEIGINFYELSANCWLTGIKAATSNFSQGTTAETFEAAAACLRVIGNQPANNESQTIPEVRPNEAPFEGENFPSQKTTQDNGASKDSPADRSWFSPKIYKSSTSIK
ncbi:MAG: DHH family phosphoesterase [Patescibacteria group bacterium]|nr:DHH family phosphoesterase [Patescibacteria group bacterium]